jgi:hypothetical protein
LLDEGTVNGSTSLRIPRIEIGIVEELSGCRRKSSSSSPVVYCCPSKNNVNLLPKSAWTHKITMACLRLRKMAKYSALHSDEAAQKSSNEKAGSLRSDTFFGAYSVSDPFHRLATARLTSMTLGSISNLLLRRCRFRILPSVEDTIRR